MPIPPTNNPHTRLTSTVRRPLQLHRNVQIPRRFSHPNVTSPFLSNPLAVPDGKTPLSDCSSFPTPSNVSYGWHFQYLTIIGLSIATATFTLGSLADLTQSNRLFRLKNTLSVCVTPMEVLISILYWGIRSVNKDLVIPKWAQLGLVPDLGFHFVPSAALTLDFLLFSPSWTITFPRAALLSGSIAFSYWFWVEECHRQNGWYPYPLFEPLTTGWRIVVFSASALVMAGSTMALKAVHGIVNGYDEPRSRSE